MSGARTAAGGGALAAVLALAAPAAAQAPTPRRPGHVLRPQPPQRRHVHRERRAPRRRRGRGPPARALRAARPVPRRLRARVDRRGGADGEFIFTVKPVRKAYWAVVAPQTTTRPREASNGFLVAVRRKVSIRTTTRRPRRGRFVRFSGFVSPSFPLGPGSVATLQRRNAQGGFNDVKSALLKAAGAFSSYRLRTRVRRSGVYRVVVPASTFFSTGRERRRHAAHAPALTRGPDGSGRMSSPCVRCSSTLDRRPITGACSGIVPDRLPPSPPRPSCRARCSRRSARRTSRSGAPATSPWSASRHSSRASPRPA